MNRAEPTGPREGLSVPGGGWRGGSGAERDLEAEPQTLTWSGGSAVAGWLCRAGLELSPAPSPRWSGQPGLGAVVLLTERPVAQDVVDFGDDVGRHLGEDLRTNGTRKRVTGGRNS